MRSLLKDMKCELKTKILCKTHRTLVQAACTVWHFQRSIFAERASFPHALQTPDRAFSPLLPPERFTIRASQHQGKTCIKGKLAFKVFSTEDIKPEGVTKESES